MLQHYRLRLGDGTVLQVDQDGLSAWLDDARAMVQAAGSHKWCPLREFVWELRASAGHTARREADARAALPLIPPPPRVREEETLSAPSPPPGEPAEIPTVEPPGLQVLADDPAPPPEEPTLRPWAPPLLDTGASVQVLADDPVAQPAGDTRETSAPDDPGPVIPFKPLDDDEAPAYEIAGSGDDEDDAGEVDEEIDQEVRQDRLEGALLDVLSALGSFLSVWLTRLDRLGRRWPSASADARQRRRDAASSLSAPQDPPPSVGLPTTVQVLAADPMASPLPYGGKRSTDDGLPVIPLEPLDSDEPPPRGAPTLEKLRSVASGWVDGLNRAIARSTHPDRPQPSIPQKKPAPVRAALLPPRDPLTAPPPISELPVLRFADNHEPPEVADIFEAEDGESFLPVAWLWTKRVVLIAGLVAVGLYASFNWETWFPEAAQLGQRMFAEIDTLVRSRDQTERQERALLAATEQLPHLSPQTVRLLFTGSPTGTLEPPEVFRRAWEAADRGREALTPGEAEELRVLRGQLLDTLRRTERARILEYDSARDHRATFAFEDRHVLDLFSRATRALPEPSRQRLQTLLGRAVAAGLAPPTAAAPRAAATR